MVVAEAAVTVPAMPVTAAVAEPLKPGIPALRAVQPRWYLDSPEFMCASIPQMALGMAVLPFGPGSRAHRHRLPLVIYSNPCVEYDLRRSWHASSNNTTRIRVEQSLSHLS